MYSYAGQCIVSWVESAERTRLECFESFLVGSHWIKLKFFRYNLTRIVIAGYHGAGYRSFEQYQAMVSNKEQSLSRVVKARSSDFEHTTAGITNPADAVSFEYRVISSRHQQFVHVVQQS